MNCNALSGVTLCPNDICSQLTRYKRQDNKRYRFDVRVSYKCYECFSCSFRPSFQRIGKHQILFYRLTTETHLTLTYLQILRLQTFHMFYWYLWAHQLEWSELEILQSSKVIWQYPLATYKLIGISINYQYYKMCFVPLSFSRLWDS